MAEDKNGPNGPKKPHEEKGVSHGKDPDYVTREEFNALKEQMDKLLMMLELRSI